MCDNLEINQIPEYRFDGIVYHDVYSCRILKGQDEDRKARIRMIGGGALGHECPFYANNTMGSCLFSRNRNN